MAIDANGAYYPVIPDVSYPPNTRGTLRRGAGVPSNDLGQDGDIYINLSTGDIYIKNGGSYTVLQGVPGGSGEAGVGSPEGVVSAPIGTSYVDTSNGEFYFKVEGVGNTGWFGPYIS